MTPQVPDPSRRRGRVLAIRPGYNPNSSSLGVDLTLMLLGSAALSIVITLISTFVRLRMVAAREGAGGHPPDPGTVPPEAASSA